MATSGSSLRLKSEQELRERLRKIRGPMRPRTHKETARAQAKRKRTYLAQRRLAERRETLKKRTKQKTLKSVSNHG